MSKEINMPVGLSVRKTDPATGLVIVASPPWSRQNQIDMAGSSGPYIGTIAVPTTGTEVDLSSLGAAGPGAGWHENQDPVNHVDFGIKDKATGKFYPLGRLPPATGFPIYFSPHLGLDESSGAGSSSAGTTRLFYKAYGGTVNVYIGAYPL